VARSFEIPVSVKVGNRAVSHGRPVDKTLESE